MYYLSLLLVFLLSQIALASNQIVLIGAPGAGKGTLAAQLKEALNIPHISSGDIVRAEIFAGTEFGKKVVEYNNKGQLLPDTPEFMGMLFEALKNRLMKPDCDQGFILDGIPRTEQQAHQLEEVLKKIGKALDSAILIDVSNQTLLDRLAGRVICKTCNLSYHMLFQPPKHEGKCDHCEKCLVKRSDDCL
jgi:adenylate kinase